MVTEALSPVVMRISSFDTEENTKMLSLCSNSMVYFSTSEDVPDTGDVTSSIRTEGGKSFFSLSVIMSRERESSFSYSFLYTAVTVTLSLSVSTFADMNRKYGKSPVSLRNFSLKSLNARAPRSF